jgi:hypothetical protein
MPVMKSNGSAYHRRTLEVRKVRTHFEYSLRPRSQRVAELKNRTAELERRLSAARVALEREVAQSASGPVAAPGRVQETLHCAPEDSDSEHDADRMWAFDPAPEYSPDYGSPNSGDQAHSPEGRTEALVNHGRRSAYYPGLSRGRKVATGTAVAAVLVITLVLILSGGGASWPNSVAAVQSEATRACQNPDVKSEPSQVNFACAKTTRQILWVFALMTSADNPNFADTTTGRLGLEPITPAQGGEVAWSLNLHHPYNPSNPIDSLEVAARAINNIIGGATLTSADGRLIVQPGLESNSANCVRYTGTAAITSRKGFPGLCVQPVTSAAGQAALVADVYQKWVLGAAPRTAQDAAVLFENAQNPGDPRVQAILKHLPNRKL